MSAETPTLEELLLDTIRATKGSMFVRIPATVMSYDQVAQTCTARPAVQAFAVDPVTDVLTAVNLPDVANVPVRWMAAGGASITMPLTAGDPVMLEVADRSLDEWKNGTPLPYAPVDKRRFDLTDAIAVPQARVPIAIDGVAAGALVMKHDDIRQGSAAASIPATLSTPLKTFLDLLKIWLDAHTHSGVVTGGGVTGPPAPLSPSVPDIAATKVKIE